MFRYARPLGSLAVALLVGALTGSETQAQDSALKVGDRAPSFEALDDRGQLWRSADHVGDKLLVVYFYPAAMTGGCTKQACAFRDDRTTLTSLGAEVVGISGDRVENLKVFKGQNRLNFPLLSDSAGTIARAFGVPLKAGGVITRTVDGREIELKRDVTTARWTFIIDRNGRIAYRDTEVDAEGDSKAVISAIRRMSSR